MKRFFLAALCVAIFLCLSFRASAQNIEIGTGLVCDRADQVEAVGYLFPEKGHAGAIAAVNEKSPSACGIITVAYIVGETKSTVTVNGRYYAVVEIQVVGIAANGQWQKLSSPLTQYTAIELDGKSARNR